MLCTLLCGMSSCIYDREGVEIQSGDDTQTIFVLHIAPISMQAAQSSDRVVAEKIRTLRVIAISRPAEGSSAGENGEGTIEINRLINFSDPSASGFSYSLSWKTTPGKKDFYIFANEKIISGVGSLQFAADADVPDAVKSMESLTEVLNRYKATPSSDKFGLSDNANASTDNNTADDGNEAPSSASEFKTVINAMQFAPQYTIDENAIFLPYSTCYEDVEVNAGINLKDMFLVPVATKFYFRFYNYRKHAVKIQELTIKKTDSKNFLLGQVGDDDRTKVFTSDPDDESKNERYYWVDWLAKVADETHKNLTPDNGDINERYGWISDYSMPETSVRTEQTLIGGDGTDPVGGRLRLPEATIPARGPLEDMAGDLYLGPYYFPESRFMVSRTEKDENNADVTVEEQQYTMGLHLHDTEVDSSTSNDFKEDLAIGNVRSLFRDTCVLIQVTMREGDVEVYAEMADWVHKEVEGWAGGGDQL